LKLFFGIEIGNKMYQA